MPILVDVLAMVVEAAEYDNLKTIFACHKQQVSVASTCSHYEVSSVMDELQDTEGLPQITAEQIDAILPFLDRFEAASFSAGTWEMPQGEFPHFYFDEIVNEFIHVLYDSGWVTPSFDWTEWQDSAQKFVDSPREVENASATTIQKLLTTHCRMDRFCEGHLASVFQSGHIVLLLRRLKSIRSTMQSQGS